MRKSVCGENCPNYQYIDEKIFKLVVKEDSEILSDMFRLFSDSTRMKIICSILNKELRVTDICEELDMNRTTVSHQLKTLRESKLVKYRKSGTEVYYSLKDAHIEQIIIQAMDHLKEEGIRGL